MYRKKDRSIQQQIQFITLEDLVPQDHILRKIDRAIDFNFIYEEVEGLYSPYDMGRPGIDPVSLFKIVFIQYLFGIRSMRQTIKEINVNVAYRWFIGYGLLEPVPHFSTFSKNYTRRFQGTAVFEHIFQRILEEAVNAGFVDASAIFIDGTHIKASANKNKSEQVKVTKPAKQYQKELDDEIGRDREQQGKGKLPPKEEKQETTITQSKTDPESGLFVKGEHERQFAYVANTACDKHNFILDFVVGAGNIHDSQMFHALYEKLGRISQATESIVVDAGYRTPGIAREILRDGKIPVVPYKRPMTKEGFFKKHEYVYDEYYDCYLCPENQVLKYATTNREGYREYKSDPKICQACPKREKCTLSRNHTKVVTRHVWADYSEQGDIQAKETNHRTCLCRCEGKAWHEIHNAAWPGESDNAGDAYLCVHELEKAGNMERKDREIASRCGLLFMVVSKNSSKIPPLWNTNRQMPRFLWIRNGAFVYGLQPPFQMGV